MAYYGDNLTPLSRRLSRITMPNICIFCPNTVNSREHVWPMWIHERKDFGPLNFRRGDGVVTVIPDPKVTARLVCDICNNGWMSKLEEPNIPIISCMMQDISMTLDREQQGDRKSTRLNSSHLGISYAVFC